MPKTITQTYSISGYTLSAAAQGVLNPVSVTGSIDIGTGTAPAALYGQTPGVWTVTNAGSITGDAVAGIELAAGGAVTNNASGFLSGHYAVKITGGPGGVTNAGTIIASGTGTASAANVAIGVWLTTGGAVANQQNARIAGQGWGIAIQGGAGTVTNAGTIDGVAADGVYLNSGTVTNQSTGRIAGQYGIAIKTSGGVTNAGTVTGGTSATQSGIYVSAGNVTNQSGGMVSGAYGIIIRSAGTLSNAGTVSGSGQAGAFLRTGLATNLGTMTGAWGLVIQGGTGTAINGGLLVGTTESGAYLTGGTVTNSTGGLISGVSGVVIRTAAGTVVNYGQIEAVSTAGYAVYLAPGFADRVVFEPGAAFTGLVDGGNTVAANASVASTLELGATSLMGTLSGLGTQFINFAGVTIDPGAAWLFSGVNTIAAGATLLDQGTVTLNDAVLFGGATSTISGTAGATAGLTITGAAATWVQSAPIVVGATGDGAMLVANQGTVSALATAARAAVALGVGAAANGAMEVAGSGSRLSAIGQLTVGLAGGGQLRVDTGGTVVSGADANLPSQGLEVGQQQGSSGDVTVTGAGSDLSNTGAFMIGDDGMGGLAIAAGGTVITTPGTVAGLAGAVIANSAGANGSWVGVSGAGSNWRVGGLLDVGANGSGSLNINSGATVDATSLDSANIAAAVGQITVTDAGSALIVAGAATISDDGTGVLSVLNGASFSAQSLTIGNQTDSSGALIVSGNNTTLTIAGQLNIGTALGTGDLTVGPGAVVDASVINLQGGVVLEGGLLDPTVYIENGGSTTGGFGTIASDYILLEGTILSNGSKTGKQTEVVQGTLVGGGTADIKGSVSVNGPGILQIGTHDTIELTGAVLNAATTTFTDNLTPTGTYTVNNSVIDVVFQDATGVLALDDIAGFAGTVATWKAGDSFVITGGTLSNLGVSNGNTLTAQDSGGGAGAGGIDQIIFGSAISQSGFAIVNGNTLQAVSCFAEGTRIGTPGGMVAVEELRVGDRVLTIDGTHEAIVFLGQRAVHCHAHPAPETVWPVRVRAGAFGENVPVRDLYLSPDHAVYVNDALVPVKLLINGASIAQTRRDHIVYHHVELPRHAVIFAEDMPVESYLDIGDRSNFHNSGEVMRLFPDFTGCLSSVAAAIWESRGGAPLILAGPELAAARARVNCVSYERFAASRS